MTIRIFYLIIASFLLVASASEAQSYFEFDEGSFRVHYHAQTTGQGGGYSDFTTKSPANLEFFDIANPKIMVIISKLKWNPGYEANSLVIKKNWILNAGGLSPLTTADIVLNAQKTEGAVLFKVNESGNHSITIQYGIKAERQKIHRVKEVKIPIYRKFSAIGVGEKKGAVPDRTDYVPVEKSPEDRFWDQAVVNNTLGWYQNYVSNYPNGKYLNTANKKINELSTRTKTQDDRIRDYPKANNGSAKNTGSEKPVFEASGSSQDKVKQQEEQRTTTTAADAAAATADLLEEKAWKKVLEANTFKAYHDFYHEGKGDPVQLKTALDSLKKIPIKFEFLESNSRDNGDYAFKIQFANAELLELKADKDARVQAEKIDSITQLVVLGQGMPQTVVFVDEFGREIAIKLDPEYSILHVVLEEKEDHLEYHIYGGTPPYFISFLREGSQVRECLQRIEKEGELNKIDWAGRCDLQGVYWVEFMDAKKAETKRFPKSETGFIFEAPTLELLKYMWIVFLPILGLLIWFIRKRL